jgi:hypothetical protein
MLILATLREGFEGLAAAGKRARGRAAVPADAAVQA